MAIVLLIISHSSHQGLLLTVCSESLLQSGGFNRVHVTSPEVWMGQVGLTGVIEASGTK